MSYNINYLFIIQLFLEIRDGRWALYFYLLNRINIDTEEPPQTGPVERRTSGNEVKK